MDYFVAKNGVKLRCGAHKKFLVIRMGHRDSLARDMVAYVVLRTNDLETARAIARRHVLYGAYVICKDTGLEVH